MSTTTTSPAGTPGRSAVRRWRAVLRAGAVLGVLVLMLVLAYIATPHFLTADNLVNVARQASLIGIVGVGMTFVILTAGIDLSVGSAVSMVAVVSATLLSLQTPVPLAVVAGLAVGAAVGVVNGLGVTLAGVLPFIMTLGMLTAGQGIALMLSNGEAVGAGKSATAGFDWLGSGDLLGIPVPVWLFGVVAAVAAFLLRRTTFGRRVYAVGDNREAARLSGINVKRVLFSVYVIAGFLARLAGLVYVSLVGIARALSRQARVIVLDEPSAVLGEAEIATLFDIVRVLRQEGIAFVDISHRLKEIFEIADRVTVLCDGRTGTTRDTGELDRDEIVRLMVGRRLDEIYPGRDRRPGPVLLRGENLTRRGVLQGVSFVAHAGEILGVAGLAGAGRSELLPAVVAADPHDSGRIWPDGKPRRFRKPQDAIAAGIAMLPEGRQAQGLFGNRSVLFNITIGHLGAHAWAGVLRNAAERREAAGLVGRLRVRAPELRIPVRELFGGNQQKCVRYATDYGSAVATTGT